MLTILAFSVIVWMTETIDHAVSAIVIAALTLAFSDFANMALVLVVAALFLAAALEQAEVERVTSHKKPCNRSHDKQYDTNDPRHLMRPQNQLDIFRFHVSDIGPE